MSALKQNARVLVVDDDPLLRKMIRFVLIDRGYDVAAVGSGEAALRLLDEEDINLLILDVKLPGMSGLDLCRDLRAQRNGIPICFLSAQQEVDHRIAGFDAGGDDYLTKPFEPRELVARVHALIQRQTWGITIAEHDPLEAGGLVLLADECAVLLPQGERVSLAPTEMRLLKYLMLNERRIVTRDQILQSVWGGSYETDSNPVDVYIRRLRRKLGTPVSKVSTEYIETIRGLGYRFVAGTAEAISSFTQLQAG